MYLDCTALRRIKCQFALSLPEGSVSRQRCNRRVARDLAAAACQIETRYSAVVSQNLRARLLRRTRYAADRQRQRLTLQSSINRHISSESVIFTS